MSPDSSPRTNSAEEFASERYCVVDMDGHVSQTKLRLATTALEAAGGPQSPLSGRDVPVVAGVPRLAATLERVEDIAAVVRHFLPIVERDPRLHALSFVNPLKLAVDELGIAVSPAVARYMRRVLRGAVTFADSPTDPEALAGIVEIRWVSGASAQTIEQSAHRRRPAIRTPNGSAE